MYATQKDETSQNCWPRRSFEKHIVAKVYMSTSLKKIKQTPNSFISVFKSI